MGFSVFFQASTGKKLHGKNNRNNMGPRKSMLNIPLGTVFPIVTHETSHSFNHGQMSEIRPSENISVVLKFVNTNVN